VQEKNIFDIFKNIEVQEQSLAFAWSQGPRNCIVDLEKVKSAGKTSIQVTST